MFDSNHIKYASLIVLAIKNAAFVLISRYSKALVEETYITSVMICISEIVKLITSFLLLCLELKSIRQAWKHVRTIVLGNFTGTLVVSLPAFLYVIQNNLVFLAISNLDAPTFQICFQLKILTTACFAYFMLKKKLSQQQIIALIILFVGISIVSVYSNTSTKKLVADNPQLGIICVLIACIISGFAGVYSEKFFKQKNSSLWLINLQMALIGTLIAAITCVVTDFSVISHEGPFTNFGLLAWIVVFFQSVGGLLVAVVMKYADNILKGYATSFSILLSTIVSIFLFNVELKSSFVVGGVAVVVSTVVYSYFPYKCTI